MGWTYAVTDWRTGRLLDDSVPFTDVTFTTGLGLGNGTFSGVLDRATCARWRDLLLERRRVIWPMLDGTPVCAPFVVLSGQAGFGQARAQVVGVRVDEILNRREIRSTLVFQNVDQLDMIRDIVRYAVGIRTQFTSLPVPSKAAAATVPWWRLDEASLSGVRRDRLDNSDGFQGGKAETVASGIGRLLNLVNAPEWVMVAGSDNGNLWAAPRLGYPRLGRGADESAVVLDWPGGTIRSGTWTSDASDTVTDELAVGATPEESVVAISARAVDDNAHDIEQWPLLEDHTADDSVTEIGTLASRAADDLRAFTGPNATQTVVLDARAVLDISIGDTASLVVQERWGTTMGEMRVIGWSCTPAAGTLTPVLSDGWD